MSDISRVSVSLPSELLARFDARTDVEGYPTRSKAVADLIRDYLVAREWSDGGTVAGAVVLVYDHHRPELTATLTSIQHDVHELIVSTQHVHLDHHHCLEIVVLRGPSDAIRSVANRLRTVKGVAYASVAMATTGEGLL